MPVETRRQAMNLERRQQQPPQPGFRVGRHERTSESKWPENDDDSNDGLDDENDDHYQPEEQEENDNIVVEDELEDDDEAVIESTGKRSPLYPNANQGRETRRRITHREFSQKTQITTITGESSSSPFTGLTGVFLMAAFLGIIILVVSYPELSSHFLLQDNKLVANPDIPENAWDLFRTKFTAITSKYKGIIPKKGWKVIKASLKDVLDIGTKPSTFAWDSLAPSVILILGKEKDKNVTCFANDLAKIISSSLSEEIPSKVDGEHASDANTIIRQFDHNFRDLGRHAILVDGLNKLNGKAALSLHRYTDHATSVYKDAVILLVGYTDKVNRLNADSSLREMDEVATDLLKTSWIKNIDEDQISSLVSRLTPSVTAVLHTADSTTTVC